MHTFGANTLLQQAPLSLSSVQFLGSSEVRKILVVGEDYCGERRFLEVMSPCFKGADYAHEFSVIYFIVSLCHIEGV